MDVEHKLLYCVHRASRNVSTILAQCYDYINSLRDSISTSEKKHFFFPLNNYARRPRFSR